MSEYKKDDKRELSSKISGTSGLQAGAMEDTLRDAPERFWKRESVSGRPAEQVTGFLEMFP